MRALISRMMLLVFFVAFLPACVLALVLALPWWLLTGGSLVGSDMPLGTGHVFEWIVKWGAIESSVNKSRERAERKEEA